MIPQSKRGAVAGQRRPRIKHAERAVSALLALRAKPLTAAGLGRVVGVSWRTGYRLIDDLRAAGVPIQEGERREGERGGMAAVYQITAADLRRWLYL